MITRRALLLAGAAVSACGTREGGGAPPFPTQAAGWTLEAPPDAAADLNGSQGAWTARYSGQPPLRVTVYRMSSQTAAFAQVQNWRPEPSKLAFYKGSYFGIAEGDGADHATLNRFASAVQEAFP